MASGSGASPPTMTIALAAAATASTGSGQRRRAAIGLHTTNATSRRWPRSCGYDTPSVTSVAHRPITATVSHRGQPGAQEPRGEAPAISLLATTPTVTSGFGRRISLEDDGYR